MLTKKGERAKSPQSSALTAHLISPVSCLMPPASHPRTKAEAVSLQATCLTRQFPQIDYLPLTHAIHRLSGIVTPASAAYSTQELEHQLRTSGSKAVFTCAPLLDNALQAADAVGIPRDRIFIVPISGADNPASYVTIDDLVAEGKKLPPLKPLQWVKGQGARQAAYLCYSSGTSGMPVSKMIGVLLSKSYKRHCWISG